MVRSTSPPTQAAGAPGVLLYVADSAPRFLLDIRRNTTHVVRRLRVLSCFMHNFVVVLALSDKLQSFIPTSWQRNSRMANLLAGCCGLFFIVRLISRGRHIARLPA